MDLRSDAGDRTSEAGSGIVREEGAARVRAHWYTLASAASLLGVSESAVRKRIQDGSLTGIRIGRGWKVLLPGEQPERERESSRQPVKRDAEQLAQTSESLVVLVRDLQRQNLALAGQIGYLQSQLAQASREAVQGQDSAAPGGSAPAVSEEEHQAALREIEELRASVLRYREELDARPARKKRWWRR